MHYLYGPVPSRRLGRSLGIDPFVRKTCTHDCIYCQLGSGPTVSSEIAVAGVSPIEIENELVDFFDSGGDTDFITFSGSGEPTLWKHIGALVDFIRANFPDKKLAVITNGTTLWREDIRKAIMPIDLIVPTVSTADEDTYMRLHRANRGADFSRYIEGIKKFAGEFHGEIWTEVMLVAGVNDSEQHILKLRKILDEISPAHIDLNTPVRPPSESWVQPPDESIVRKTCVLLGERCRIVGKFVPTSEKILEIANLAQRILDILRRRPENAKSLAAVLDTEMDNVQEALDAIVAKKLAVQNESGYYEAIIKM